MSARRTKIPSLHPPLLAVSTPYATQPLLALFHPPIEPTRWGPCGHSAEAVNRLDISESDPKTDLPELVDNVVGGAVQSGAKRKTAGAIDAVKERVEEVFSRDEHEDRND